jgi:hypothetical protein
VDVCGNAHVTGETRSEFFPTKRPFQGRFAGSGPPNAFCAAGCGDAYVAKLNAKGSRLVFSSYLGGSDGEFSNALALDHVGNVHMAGLTDSRDFPLVKPLQPNYGGGTADVFVAKIAERRGEDREDDGDDCRVEEHDGERGGDDDGD